MRSLRSSRKIRIMEKQCIISKFLCNKIIFLWTFWSTLIFPPSWGDLYTLSGAIAILLFVYLDTSLTASVSHNSQDRWEFCLRQHRAKCFQKCKATGIRTGSAKIWFLGIWTNNRSRKFTFTLPWPLFPWSRPFPWNSRGVPCAWKTRMSQGRIQANRSCWLPSVHFC